LAKSPLRDTCSSTGSNFSDSVISNDAGHWKSFFLRSLLESSTLLHWRTDCVCFWTMGVLHHQNQASLRRSPLSAARVLRQSRHPQEIAQNRGLLLLVGGKTLQEGKTSRAVRATFTRRGRHAIPNELAPPPPEWEQVFNALAEECHLGMKLQAGFLVVRKFVGTLRL
jgi:hypothetical protein